MPAILIIHRESEFALKVAQLLKNEGYEVQTSVTSSDGINHLCTTKADLVLVESAMTDVSGLDICRQIRMMTDTPLILVSVDHDGELVVGGLEIGVDDFADSHMSDRELLARVKVASRRPRRTHNPTGLPSVAGYEIDRRARSVTCPNGVQIELTNLEFDLLVLFVANPGVALEREVIFNRVWGQRGLGASRTIDTHVVTLRNKIPELKLSSVHGIGYRLDPIAPVA